MARWPEWQALSTTRLGLKAPRRDLQAVQSAVAQPKMRLHRVIAANVGPVSCQVQATQPREPAARRQRPDRRCCRLLIEQRGRRGAAGGPGRQDRLGLRNAVWQRLQLLAWNDEVADADCEDASLLRSGILTYQAAQIGDVADGEGPEQHVLFPGQRVEGQGVENTVGRQDEAALALKDGMNLLRQQHLGETAHVVDPTGRMAQRLDVVSELVQRNAVGLVNSAAGRADPAAV